MEFKEIVLIEDNEDDLEIAQRALRRNGLLDRVAVLRDGRAALEFAIELREAVKAGRGVKPRAVFLDLRLPRVDGKRVLEELRADASTRDIPVIIVSSTRRDSEIEECYRLGANSFIPKQYGQAAPGEYLVQAARYWLDLNRVAQ